MGKDGWLSDPDPHWADKQLEQQRRDVRTVPYTITWDTGVAHYPYTSVVSFSFRGYEDVLPTVIRQIRDGLAAIGIESKITKQTCEVIEA